MSDDKPHKCTHLGCSSSFTTKYNLEQHMNTVHSDERPFVCTFPECFSSFKLKSKLTRHMAYHREERPFVCTFPDCFLSFKTKEDLTRHMAYHREERPYVCTFPNCFSSFKRKDDLNQHMICHREERTFVCDFFGCGASFKIKANLSRHQKCIHSEESQQRRKKSETATYNSLLKCKLDLKREHQINVSCNGGHFYRIDYVHISNGVMFFIENDEHQHDHYPVSCEIRRMINTKSVLLQEGNNMPLVFIRYNPDAYRVDNQVKKTKKEDRIKQLVKLIQTISQQPGNCPPLSIYYLFYDMINKEPTIFQDSEYVQEVKSLVKCIYE